MELGVERAVLHILDTQADSPVISDCLIQQEESLHYLGALASKAFGSAEAKGCRMTEESVLHEVCDSIEEKFLAHTSHLARRWFSVMEKSADIPAADVVFLLLVIDGQMYFAGLKLNYKAGWVHYFQVQDDGTAVNELVCQETLLPSPTAKPDEAFFVRLHTNAAQRELYVLEKQYEIDGEKRAYLSNDVLGAKAGLSPKQKLHAICEAAVEVNRQFYGNLGVEQPEVAAAVCEEYRTQRSAASKGAAEQVQPTQVVQLCEKLYGDVPHAREAFEQALAEHEIALDEPLPMPAAGVRRLEKQSLRSAGGVEIKVPVSVYRDSRAVEFIRNDDGSVSLLVKNIIME